MTAVNITSFIVALTAAAGLSGCGEGAPPRATASESIFVDDMFDGVFVSKSFECVKGDVHTPIGSAGEIRRTIIIVNDHILVTDVNTRGYLVGETGKNSGKFVDVVSRYYDVKGRAATEPTKISLELGVPGGHDLVFRMRHSLEGRAIPESGFHPISSALRSAASATWHYAFKEFKLHVATVDTPEAVCPGGGTLHIVLENRTPGGVPL